MNNIITHFKRQGSGSTLILQGLPRHLYIQSDSNKNYVKVEKNIEIPKTFNDKTYYETHCEVLLYKKYENIAEDFKEIETDINNVIDVKIEIENFIESYYIGSKTGDRDILNGYDITNKSVLQVITQCKINLYDFFKPWNREMFTDLLKYPTEKVLNKKFSELYTFIHWYGIKSHEESTREFLQSI